MTITDRRHTQSTLQRLAALLLSACAAALALLLILSLARASEPMTGSDILCVKPGGGDGCQASINDALALANDHDTIRVAQGTYTENVVISRNLTLQGGWNSDFTLRDVTNFSATIAPADNTQSVVQIQGDIADSSLIAPTLDGFVISGGRAYIGSNHGGGLAIHDSDALVISNTISDNIAFLLGGGVWVQRGGPMLQGNRVISNQVRGLGQEALGGGVQLENSQALVISNTFLFNVVSGTLSYGGGLAVSGVGSADVALGGNVFFSNTAGLQPGGGFGGAISVINGRAVMENNDLIGNHAAQQGGAIYLTGSAFDCCRISGQGDRIQANQAAQGGGIYNDGQTYWLSNGLAFSNTAVTQGGAYYIAPGGRFSVTNSALVDNSSGSDGGAIYNSGTISLTNSTLSRNSATSLGGAIANFAEVLLRGSTIAANDSPNGAGLMNASLVEVQNSLIAENIGDNCQGALFSLGNNLEDGGTCAMGQPTDQNNTAPALNSLADYGGETLTYALMPGSPAIDAGDNASCAPIDQRGVPRPLDGDGDGVAVCDIGAFEYQPEDQPPLEVYLPIVLRGE